MAGAQLVGRVFERLTVLKQNGYYHSGGSAWKQWLCECECGEFVTVPTSSLTSGKTKSCGCYQIDKNKEGRSRRSHGMTGTSEYNTWKTMLQRCYNFKHDAFPWYGGRGITICEEWIYFENFIKDMGLKPTPEHSIDRIDNNGNYEPSNCRWATKVEQANNRR